MAHSKILVVGSFVMDLIVSTNRFPERGETVLGNGFRTAPGGKGSNQAVQAARVGAQVTMIGSVGQDDFGTEILKNVAASGVDVSQVIRSEKHSTAVGNVQIETKDGNVNNRIIVVPGANMGMTAEDFAFLKGTIGQYDMVILQLEIPMEVNCAVAKYAHEAGVPVMLNSAPYADLPSDLLQNITFISPNETEASLMTGRKLENDDDIGWALREIQRKGVKNAMITLGSRGAAYLGEHGNMLVVPAASGLSVQDPTAAGDSFVGAFCYGVTCGLPVGRAMEFANYAAGLTCCKMGALPSLPYLKDVIGFMRERGLNTKDIEAHLQ